MTSNFKFQMANDTSLWEIDITYTRMLFIMSVLSCRYSITHCFTIYLALIRRLLIVLNYWAFLRYSKFIGALSTTVPFSFNAIYKNFLSFYVYAYMCNLLRVGQMKVMDNKLFAISPKAGKLKAGGTCAVTFTYSHLMPGTDRVPVLLKLSRGREIMVSGTTCYKARGLCFT